jgi:hypothetical protein
MMKKFNTTAICIPGEHYMVDISGKLVAIKKMVDAREYFTINRARQYGKTTTLALLESYISPEYLCVSISFEVFGGVSFASEASFCAEFCRKVSRALKFSADESVRAQWNSLEASSMSALSDLITDFCQDKKVVLLIDEVDQASNYEIFMLFLKMLRAKYIERGSGRDYTFQSVILAGVHDVKNLKIRMVEKGHYSAGEVKHDSPWNVASAFTVDMSFCPAEIATMLTEYEADTHCGMDIGVVAAEIYAYTGGYPYLVSNICKTIAESQDIDWTQVGVQSAVKIVLAEQSTLFDDLIKNLQNDETFAKFVYGILINGDKIPSNTYSSSASKGLTYGIFSKSGDYLLVSNRIFEIFITNYFIGVDIENETIKRVSNVERDEVVERGNFDMSQCLVKFAYNLRRIYNYEDAKDVTFLEKHGKMLFLAYLTPLINGVGFYHTESTTVTAKRLDIVVDYGSKQYIVELKLWHGATAHDKAYDQLAGYLEQTGHETGYLLTFDFRKVRGEERAQWVSWRGKKIFDVLIPINHSC